MLIRLAIAAVLLLTAASSGNAQEKITLRLDFPPWGTHGPIHLATEKGWYKEAGLDVTIQDGTGSGNTIQLVGSGQVEVGWVQLGVMAIARDADLKITSFAGVIRKGDLAVLVDRDAPIHGVKDLKGKSLSVVTGGPWTPYINAYLRSAGLDTTQVNIASVAPPTMIPTYAARQFDGILAPAPWGIPLVESSRPSKALLMADANIAFPSYGLIALEDSVKAKRDALRRLAGVFVRAWTYTFDGHVDEAVQAIIRQRPGARLDPLVLTGQLSSYRDFVDTPNTKGKALGWQSEQDWTAAIKAMEDARVIKPGRKPAEFFTNELLP
jgi:NitT/TauT family transport system substrate-binding protein